MEFAYRLTGTGWAEARLADGSSMATLTASYLNDALGLLLDAVGSVLGGAREARCSWAEEPGEYRWILDGEGDQVRVRVLGFRDAESPESDDKGVVLFDQRLPLREFATAIAHGAQEVLDEYGEVEYLRLWGEYPFPSRQLRRIEAQLANG